jgi:hydroxymethylglutaryl-CoA lyase
MGCYEVSLGDTVGKGTPEKTTKLLDELTVFPLSKLAVHFHDTFDNAIENILTAIQMGKEQSIYRYKGC